MNKYQEISRRLVKKRLREKLEHRRLDNLVRETRARRDRKSSTATPKLH